ncbi:hypothetical protein BWI17_07055 [Betaproteobacteria bacterium GR16-43]|nr:hypothetical protein BWI17_07055 [Betaproteobacteria bacterium GR16-43]
MDETPKAPGAGATLLALIGTRIELLGIEVREEALHVQRLLVLGVVAAFVLGAALVMAGIFVAAVFWERYGLLALGAVTALYAIVGIAVLMRVRSIAYRRAGPFQATLHELEEDLRALREK